MAHSRLEKIGTIYSRITGLIKTGAMKLEERPIWYEVYEAFPPETTPVFNQKISEKPIKIIFYPEDNIRAKFYKRISNSPMGRLDDAEHQTLSQKCISSSMALAKENNLSLEEAFEIAFNKMQTDFAESKSSETSTHGSSSLPSQQTQSLKIIDIFKEG